MPLEISLIKVLKVKKSNYNGVHSSDNEQDALYYISLLGKNYQNKITKELETRRERYSRNWNLVKLISYNDIFKEEVINYEGDLAVLKTFRPGKEALLENEILSESNKIQETRTEKAVLKVGEGFLIKPYSEKSFKEIKISQQV